VKKLNLFFALIISLVFTVSCVNKEVKETYYETENRTEFKTETYTTTENIIVSTEGQAKLFPWHTSQWNAYFNAEGLTSGLMCVYYYQIDPSKYKYANSQVRIKLSSQADGYLGVWDNTGLPMVGEVWKIKDYPERVLIFEPMEADAEFSFYANGIEWFTILANTWNLSAISSVKLVWTENTIEPRTVTKERQVPYLTPYQVEKQRTVIQKVPFWKAIFLR
jgi:hypothetical protein